jgi:hypothetical protein
MGKFAERVHSTPPNAKLPAASRELRPGSWGRQTLCTNSCTNSEVFSEAVAVAAALQAFCLSLGLDSKMRQSGLNQVEREWIVIRCVKTFVYLPAVYLNRAAHERPIDLSPRFEEATRWCGGGWRRP